MWSGAGTFSNMPVVAPANLNGDFEIKNPPKDAISAMEFSPANLQKTLLFASIHDRTVRLWEFNQSDQTELKVMLMHKTVLDVCWSEEGRNIFLASSDNQLKLWDLETNGMMVWKGHKNPIKTCNLISAPGYRSCVMTGSWDNTLKIWDFRKKEAIETINIYNKISCVDVVHPMAVICTEPGDVFVYHIGGKIEMVKRLVPLFKSKHCCMAIFKDKKTNKPTGFCLGNREGRVFCANTEKLLALKEISFSDCQSQNVTVTPTRQDENAFNDIKLHPVHNTLAFVGSKGIFSYWDKKQQFPMKLSEQLDQPITKCCFDSSGQIFAYSTGCDWSKDDYKEPTIFINNRCFEEMKPAESSNS